ncbi:ABC transporter permease subunit [Paenibacillus sp. FSL M7-0896]|uniref:ABC transporter permease subunit n=1 Tax=Paenibacillus sp. FSL M7-0896 TaxID=2921610 RepID=UPI0030DCA54D
MNITDLKAVVWKESKEIMRSMKGVIILTILTTNVLQYVTVAPVINKTTMSDEMKAVQLSALTMYLSVLVVLFLGHTFINRFLNDERKDRTIQTLLANGIDQTSLWLGKMIVTVLYTFITLLLTIGLHILFIKVFFHLSISFTTLTFILSFIGMPALGFGILALLSTVYWYFNKVDIVSFLFPLVSYLGIWNLSIKLVDNFPTLMVLIISIIIGLCFIFASLFIINKIPKERIIGKV